MQTAESFNRSSNEILHLLRVPHVGLHENCLTVLFFDCLHCRRTCGIDVTDNNLRTVPPKQERRSATNAAAPAGDQDNLIREIEWVVFFHLQTPRTIEDAYFGKIVFQSSFMLTTIQCFSIASSHALSSLP